MPFKDYRTHDLITVSRLLPITLHRRGTKVFYSKLIEADAQTHTMVGYEKKNTSTVMMPSWLSSWAWRHGETARADPST
jgi:hypothetical protein